MTQQPLKCEYCGYVLMDPLDPIEKRGFYDDSCPAGLCLQFCCARCHGVWSCNGPADCPTCCGVSGWARFRIWLRNKIKRKR